MKVEIWLGKLVDKDTYSLEFDDSVAGQRHLTVAVLHYKEGKIVERTILGIVNKSDVERLAKIA